jgi:hypothetical protein
VEPILNIKTAYWRNGKVVRLNSSKDIDRAVGQAITHMRRNRNKADYVEVYDAADADRLHAQVLRSPATGDIKIWERKADGVQASKFAATPLIHMPRPHLRAVR